MISHSFSAQTYRKLIAHYQIAENISTSSTQQTVEGIHLINLLHKLPSLKPLASEKSEPLFNQLQRHRPGTHLNQENLAALRLSEDVMSALLTQTDFDLRIEQLLKRLTPYLATALIKKGSLAIDEQTPIIKLLALLTNECIGWSEDLGVLGDDYLQVIEDQLLALHVGKTTIPQCLSTLHNEISKRKRGFDKRERELARIERTSLALRLAKHHATNTLNNLMVGQSLSMFSIFLLQGAWHDFLQNLMLHNDVSSCNWQYAEKLTEALIWSLQPRNNKHKHHLVMKKLPDQISTFCSKQHFDTSAIDRALLDINEEYKLLRQQTPSEPCDFQLLADQVNHEDALTLDCNNFKKTGQLEAASWYLYSDKNDPMVRTARLKLISNDQSHQSLLFTNFNRRKSLTLSYAQFNACVADDTIQKLKPNISIVEILEEQLTGILEATRANEASVSRMSSDSKTGSQSTKKLAEIKKLRSRKLREKIKQKHDSAIRAVAGLRVNAWIQLPLMAGVQTPCKLVGMINDKGDNRYLFANRAGVKVAEYKTHQLVNLLVTENSEILDNGDEFDQALSSVIIGLRENKTKSYSQLCGVVD